ncbi:helix-turn-helix transcriptional regulator [Rhizobium sp. SL42]|uniref:helix-turn-helix transcriptional regulator n=1 Tax=Rhizobium sp. SL42 TaxID=2806346 RepID=UPI001F2A1B95|nr:YafY family protein [Rhizobium sp. SL42]UJW76277.1 YafY family transcriptional regulator [Rhizobium sp. SL42]
MRKASRLFEIIQILKLSRAAVTAQSIADQLEVTMRSIYRDIAALQAMRVPIEGERGLGYILRPGFDLPPLMFTVEETEAIVLGLQMLERSGDTSLRRSAESVNRKIAGAVPEPLRQSLQSATLYAWGSPPQMPKDFELEQVRTAIRNEQVLRIDYRDDRGEASRRMIKPLALIYYAQSVNLVAWCELRQAIRNFRSERIIECKTQDRFFKGEGDRLRAIWTSGWASGAANAASA